MSVLIGCEKIEFTLLREKVNATDGNLTAHCKKLENAGYLKVEKLLNPSVTSSVGKVIITGFNSKNASIKSGIDSVSITDSIIE